MLESIYLLLTGIGFLFIILSLFGDKYTQKSILAGIGMILFGVLALASFKIEVLECISTACTLQPIQYSEMSWLFWGMVLISAVLLLVFILLQALNYNTKSKGTDL